MNIVTMSGRLCKEPELRKTQNGTSCCSFTLAVKRPKVKDTTDFHDCVVWQQGADYLCQYGHKGDLVIVSGPLTTREWTDKDGNKRKSVEVTCDSLELLPSKKSDNNTQQGGYNPNSYARPVNQPRQDFQQVDISDAELPF